MSLLRVQNFKLRQSPITKYSQINRQINNELFLLRIVDANKFTNLNCYFRSKLLYKALKTYVTNNNTLQHSKITCSSIYLPTKKPATMQSRNQSEERHLRTLLAINCLMLIAHMYTSNADLLYFCQLTVIGQILVILNFYLSILLHEDKCNLHTQHFLSRFHLITLALQSIVVIGYWSLRVFFSKGIVDPNKQRTVIVEMLSVYVHGGSFISMFYFIKKDQIVTETQKRKKFIFHLFWGIPFCFIQYFRWYFTGQHIYGFIKYFDWLQLIVFEVALYFVAVGVDYFISVRHGFKLLKSLQQHAGSRGLIHVKID